MAEFIVTDPAGKEHIVTAPEGVTQDQALEFAKSQFGSTQGGAATGNPSIQAQGAKALRPDVQGTNPLAEIGGASAIGAGIGAFAPELAGGAGRALSTLPFPGARALGAGLQATVPALQSAGRASSAIAGALSGAGSETAGQAAEAAGAGPATAEAARLVGGGIGPEPLSALKSFVQNVWMKVPKLSLLGQAEKAMVKGIFEKLDAGSTQSLSAQEKALLESLQTQMRQGAKSDAPLEGVGSIMGAEGKRLMSTADQEYTKALLQAGTVGQPSGYGGAGGTTLADIGGGLQTTINKRNEAALAARAKDYASNHTVRDAIVSQNEGAGKFVNDLPEFQALKGDLQSQLDNAVAMKRSPSIQAGYKKLISELTNPETTDPTQQLVLSGQNLNMVSTPGQPKPVTFQALDDVRRKLGDVFRGKPDEGYAAIDAALARDTYAKISDIQKNFAGGPNGPQAKLLDKYAADTAGLEQFSSKFGKKATALDQYREGQYATDPSTLPDTFFKTRSSINALKELTGNPTQVSAAALAYADKQLEGKTAPQVRDWMSKNAEWLAETGSTRTLIEKYATRLEGAERSMANAHDFVKQAAKDSAMLTRQSLPAQRAIDLIKSGDTELWGKIAPVIAQSPQAKSQMVSATRQVLADMPNTEATASFFGRNLRPFLEKTNIASAGELDSIAQKLAEMQALKIPESQRLGMAKRLLLQSSTGWAASAVSRTGFKSMEWAIPQ